MQQFYMPNIRKKLTAKKEEKVLGGVGDKKEPITTQPYKSFINLNIFSYFELWTILIYID